MRETAMHHSATEPAPETTTSPSDQPVRGAEEEVAPVADSTERTETPAVVLRDLLAATPHEVPGLTVTRPGLEDVYLSLVGAAPTTAGEPR